MRQHCGDVLKLTLPYLVFSRAIDQHLPYFFLQMALRAFSRRTSVGVSS